MGRALTDLLENEIVQFLFQTQIWYDFLNIHVKIPFECPIYQGGAQQVYKGAGSFFNVLKGFKNAARCSQTDVSLVKVVFCKNMPLLLWKYNGTYVDNFCDHNWSFHRCA